MAATTAPAGPVVDVAAVTFSLPDAHRRLAGVRLVQDVRVPAGQLEFHHRRGGWTLTVPRPAVDRMEYLFELEHPDRGRQTITDPNNPRRVPGAFGEKSVVEFPGYVAPGWLSAPSAAASTTALAVPSHALGTTLRGTLWTPDVLAPDEPAPLLLVHDGPEFAGLGAFLRWAGAMVAGGSVPPLRVALLAPGDRNRWYAVNPAYARALTTEVVAALAPLATARIAVGASLGALAALHAHRSRPGVFAGLFLQSGSFFHPAHDAQERRFSRYGPVTRFVTELAQAVADPAPVPAVLTCGAIEENLANNRAMTETLLRLDYPARLLEVRDVHTYTAWRDALDPHLTALVQQVTG